MKILIYITLIFLISAGGLIAQSSQEWVRSYSSIGNGYDEGIDIVTDKFDNIYVAGNSILDDQSDIILLKYNPTGELLWSKRFDGFSKNDQAKDVDIGTDGCVCITGYSENLLSISEFLTIKYDPDGNLLWAKRYSNPAYFGAISTALDIDSDNSVYVTGVSENIIPEYFTIKYSSGGDTIWTTGNYSYGYNAYYPVTINVDELKNVYSATGEGGTLIYKFDSSGINRDYVRSSSGSSINSNKGSVLGKDSYYIIGNTFTSDGYPEYLIQKYKIDNFRLQYSRGYNALHTKNTYDSANAINLGIREDVYITGSSCDSISCYISTVKFDSSLAFKWESIYRTNTNFYSGGNGIVKERSGPNVFMTGANDNYLTIKYRNATGESLWVREYNGKGNGVDVSNAIAIDSSGNIIITGRSQISGNDYDIVTIKYFQQVGVEPVNNIIPSGFLLMQNFPNPFNPATIVKYIIPSKNNIRLSVYDIEGKEISSLVNSVKNTGQYQAVFDGSKFPSGIYFCILFVDETLIDSKKMILLK